MKKLTSQFKNRWRRISSAVAVVIMFLVPATRAVFAKIAQSGSSSAATNQQGVHNKNSNKSISVKSVSAPASHSTASPVKPHDSTSCNTGGSNSSGSSKVKPKGK